MRLCKLLEGAPSPGQGQRGSRGRRDLAAAAAASFSGNHGGF